MITCMQMKEKLMHLTARDRYANVYYCFAVYHIIDDHKTFNGSPSINHMTVMHEDYRIMEMTPYKYEL